MSLHLLSLAPAAVGMCCLAADRRRPRVLELIASVLMMLAMTDAALGRLVSPVWWCALLLATAVALAALRGRSRGSMSVVGAGRHGRSGRGGGAVAAAGRGTAMGVHAAGGLVVMAALLLAMVGDAAGLGSAGASGSAHHHGTAVAGPIAVGAVLAGVYVLGSIVIAVRATALLDRAQYVAMATSVALMALALAVPAAS